MIQFRNSFDSQGPAVPGVRPAEAVGRLQDFQQRYTQYEAQRQTLDAVQILFGIPLTPYHELDKTGEVGTMKEQIKFKLLLFTFKALRGQAPNYISELLNLYPYKPTQCRGLGLFLAVEPWG